MNCYGLLCFDCKQLLRIVNLIIDEDNFSEQRLRRPVDDAVNGPEESPELLVEVADDDRRRRKDGDVVRQVGAGFVTGVGQGAVKIESWTGNKNGRFQMFLNYK